MRIVIDLQGAQSESRFRGIGRYSLSLAQAIVRQAKNHEIWIVLNAAFQESIAPIREIFSDKIPPERICLFEVSQPVAELTPANTWRTQVAELVREHFLEQLRPDVIFVTSLFEGFTANASVSVGQLTSGKKTAVTLYDLIPLLNEETYLPFDGVRAYYHRKIDSLKRAGLLLAISEYSKREAIEALGFAENHIVTISTAVDERFRPIIMSNEALAALRVRHGIQRDMVMYAPGGFDARKNFSGLINAYALLPSALREFHQLVIVSKIDDATRLQLENLARIAGLRRDEMILTGYVSDEDLVALYNSTTLFVFPSLHEGFGLPVLEAMACGAPTLGSNTTSIPEVIGLSEALFDPAEPRSIAEKMARALNDKSWLQRLRDHGLERAKKFSWDTTAQVAIAAFEKHYMNENMRVLQVGSNYEQSYQGLIEAIADRSIANQVSDNDLQLLSIHLANNFERLEC